MWDTGASGKLSSIANLIGERGEMAKQPLPVFIGAISCQLSALSESAQVPVPVWPASPIALLTVQSPWIWRGQLMADN